MPFVTCPKQDREMEVVVLHREGFLVYSCPEQGHDFKPLAAPLHRNMGQVPPPPAGFRRNSVIIVFLVNKSIFNQMKYVVICFTLRPSQAENMSRIYFWLVPPYFENV